MPSNWTLVNTHATQERIFRRPLSPAEHIFFLMDPIRDVDIARHLQLRLLNADRNASLFSDVNIMRAWVSTKRRHPLAGAIIQHQAQGVETPHFVVRERDLSVLRPREVVFRRVANAAEAQEQITEIIHGPRPLSEELLVQFYVFRESNSKEAREDILHILVMVSHCIADEMASRTLARCFLDTLARGRGSESELVQMPLEDRLSTVVSADELDPEHLRTLSPARIRWRRTIAAVIVQLRSAKDSKGCHTLPCRHTRSAPFWVVKPGLLEISCTKAQSVTMISKCRERNITLGNASLPLAQVALTRVLYRRYLRGEISEEEWTYRKRQPYTYIGFVNLRPYLDKTWFEKGGGGEVVLSVTSREDWLPFMTLGGTNGEHKVACTLSNGAPPFSDLLTTDKFLHRAQSVKKRASEFLNHPLFFELMHVLSRKVIDPILLAKRTFTSDHFKNLDENVVKESVKPVIKVSNFGNMDPTFPFEYPLPPTHALSPSSPVAHPYKAGYATPSSSASLASEADMAPTIVLEHDRLHLYPISGDIYLGLETWREQLKMFVSYDANLFEEEVVEEWLNELREAMLWYLG